MDAFYIYSDKGNLLVEQIFDKDINGYLVQKEMTDMILNKNKIERSYCILINDDYDESVIRKNYDDKFIFFIKRDDLYFIILKKDDKDPMMIIEIMREITNIFKKYFNIEKLSESILMNNYSVVNFLINEILVQGGKPNIFVDEILKNLVKNDSGFLNETLKYSPIPNNLYNMIAQRKNNLMLNTCKDKNINYSYSNGTSINSMDSRNVYWRSNNIVYSCNEIYVDVIENVNCVLNKNNRIIHFSVQGNVIVNCTITGSPLIKLYFNKNIDLKLCHLHFTVNYNMLIRKSILNQEEEKNAIHFVPMNEEYMIMQYFDYIPLEDINKRALCNKENSTFSTVDELTDVLNLKNGNIENSNTGTRITKNTQEGNQKVDKKKGLTSGSIKPEKGNVMENEKKEYTSVNAEHLNHTEMMKKKIRDEIFCENCNNFKRPLRNKKSIHKSNAKNGWKNMVCVCTNNKGKKTGGDIQLNKSIKNNNISSNSFLLDDEENNERYLLPVSVKGSVVYVPSEYMYSIKIQVNLNNINKNNNSNMILNSYENIFMKIPVHNFIRSVNFQCTIGKMTYNDNVGSVLWYIQNVVDTSIPISANIFMYIKPNEDGLYYNHDYYYDKLLICSNNDLFNGISDTTQKNGISNYCYVGMHNEKCNNNETDIYKDDSIEYYNGNACVYPAFSFPVYISLKINGIAISGKGVEKIEIVEPKNLQVRKACRYTTFYSHIEFRI
ncbi:clathrin coat assembly protein AP50 [Plasmodium gonderi]|uniref:Clathrin coat assembly protein AP50 n=1 Tax=Plasmodium gonderi TaxID=77519 RepID=A0A1Y1JJK1_PLAGO|nr:clathrin coat assembly protein AP50 [Plasmodium gonderi]GAW82679.1 clathrin coat assembly protein AP50 [Plasmodium gonderi]